MAGVEGEGEFRDADDGGGTDPPPSSPPASTPSKAKPAAAAGGFGKRLLASIGLPTSFSAAIGRSTAPSGPKPPAPQPPEGPNLGLGLLLHQGPNPSADGSLVSDASAGNLYRLPTADLQKGHEEGLGEQGAAEDAEGQVIGHDIGAEAELAVLVPTEEEGQAKEDVADGCFGNRNGYSVQYLDKEEEEEHKGVELGAAMEDQEVMEQEGATKYYTAVKDQSNNDAEHCTGDSPTPIKDDSAVEEKEALEQGCSVGTLVAAEDGIAGGLQEEDGSVHEQHKVVEECMSDELRVARGDCWVHDQEAVVVEQEGKTEYFDVAVEDQSSNAALEQHSDDEFKDDIVVEDKDKAVEQEGFIGIQGAAKDGIVLGLQKEDAVLEDQGEDGISVQDQDKVGEQCMSDELVVAMGYSAVHDQELLVVEQEGTIEHFDASVEDQIDNTALEQCTSYELRVNKDGDVVEDEDKAVEQEAAIGTLGASEDGIAVGLREEVLVMEEQGEHGISVQDQDNMVEQCMRDELGVGIGDSAVHDQEESNMEGEAEDGISIQVQQNVLEQCMSDEPGVSMGDGVVQDQGVVLEEEGVTEHFDAAVEDQSDTSAIEQCTSDELEAAKDGYFLKEKEKLMVEEGATDILGSAKNDDTVGLQEKEEVEVVAEQGEDVGSLQDQCMAVEHCTSDQVRTTTDFNAAHDQGVVEQDGSIKAGTFDGIAIDTQEKAVEQSGDDESIATKDAEDKEKEVDQDGLIHKQDAIKGGNGVELQENKGVTVKVDGEDGISARDQDKVVEQRTSDQDSAAEDQEVRREKIRFCVGYPQRPGRPNCCAYMSTGSCSYGLSCYLNHPPQLKAMPEVPSFPSEQRNREVAQILELNRVGLPIRENARNCTFFMRNGTCRYGKKCCFNHPEHVLDVQLYKPTGWDDTSLPSSPNSKKSSSPQSKKASEHVTLDDISSSSEILPPTILRMLLPPQTVPASSEAKEMKAKKDPDWSSASEDSDGCYSANNSGGPLCRQEHHLDYPERRGRQECPFLLKYGNCKFPLSCQYYHPNYKSARKYHQKDTSLAEELMVYPDKPGAPECPFYMKTGACKFGAGCKFHHPKRLVDAKELGPETKTTLQDHMDQQQNYPERPGQPECRFYMQFGKCKFLSACIFHHPKNRVAGMPECPFYMKTGACQFGSACEFYHPKHKGSSRGGEIDDGTEYGHGYPERPGENECFSYMKHGYCRFQMNCKYHHPADRFSRK